MKEPPDVLGLPLALAQERLTQAGFAVQCALTKQPRADAQAGEARVVRVTFCAAQAILTFCLFPPHTKQGSEDAPRA